MDDVSFSTSKRPVMSFDEAMQNAVTRKPFVQQVSTTPSKYRVEVYLKIPFEAETEHRSSFTPKALDTSPSNRIYGAHEAYQHPRVPFEGTTTNRETYVPHPIQRAEPPAQSMTTPSYEPVKTPFYGRSHYKVRPINNPSTRIADYICENQAGTPHSLPRGGRRPSHLRRRTKSGSRSFAGPPPRHPSLSRASAVTASTTRHTRSLAHSPNFSAPTSPPRQPRGPAGPLSVRPAVTGQTPARRAHPLILPPPPSRSSGRLPPHPPHRAREQARARPPRVHMGTRTHARASPPSLPPSPDDTRIYMIRTHIKGRRYKGIRAHIIGAHILM